MPLVRVEVRNEYALGAPEMYRGANKEDPKEILEGVAVAGLVGVLRQLGDLAEFAAEVFHGLQEDVMITTSRSHKLMTRVQRIEAAVFPLEKAVLAQRSHLHFAYTAGSNWHAHIRCEQNHFVCNDVPQFIMDSYEDCRGPPRLYLLDRFDPGGPGSCLKRYSDPTLFKRASVTSGEAGTEKNSKDKKRRKIKKRKSWPRSGEVSRGASFSYHSGRMQFTQQNVGGNSSPSQSQSTYDATLRSDLGEQSNLDLRNGSGYIEGDFRSSYSVQPEELESRESISSPVKRHDSDFLDYNFLEPKVTDVYDDVQINLSPEQAGCSSSSVTWDEKTETLEPTAKQFGTCGLKEEDVYDPIIDSYSPNLGLETLGDNVVSLETVGKTDTKPFNEAVPPLETPDIHLDDFESETDQFMDALNTIESESETDIDYMKKNEAEHYSNIEDKGVDARLCELINHDLECQSSNSGSDILTNGYLINDSSEHNPISVSPESPSAAYCSIEEVTAKIELSSVSSVDKDLQSALRTEESSNPGSVQEADSLENGNIDDSTNAESVSGAVLSNFRDDKAMVPVIDGAKNSSESQKPLPETTNVTSVMFWTNGGLLGLQPSKPPDCSLVNALPQDPLAENGGKNFHSNQHHILGGDKDAGKTKNKNFEDSLESGSSFRKTSWKISPADLEIKLGKAGNSHYPNNDNSTVASTVASRNLLPVNSEFQATRKHQENSKSSRMFELSNRLLTTGSNRKLLHGGNENSSPASFQDAGTFRQKHPQNVAFRMFSGPTKDLVGGGSPILSPCASPPLEHMKISFQPIDGFGTSKLKLKFPDGNYNDEISRDIFPSFQLVPEVFNSQKNDGSDSDDDTFYRSSPSLIDDSLSHQSESNSEQWESGESPCNKDHDLYDAFRQITLRESVSTDPGNGKNHEEIPENCGLQFPFAENGMQISKSCSLELQSLNTPDHSIREELTKDPNSLNLVESQFTATPATPPLPPVQWRGMKPNQDSMEDKATSETSKYAFDHKLSACTISQQPKPAPLNQDQITKTTNLHNSKDMHELNGQKESNQRKCTDENDFLHQIRTKSFNLRPTVTTKTVTTKPTAPSGGLANVQVNAILEKANAVRQAVGSDDGEDDGNWSDT